MNLKFVIMNSSKRNKLKGKNMNTIIDVLNKCDLAYLDGESLSWFYDDQDNTITFSTLDGDEVFSISNNDDFDLEDNELYFCVNDQEIQLDLYILAKPCF